MTVVVRMYLHSVSISCHCHWFNLWSFSTRCFYYDCFIGDTIIIMQEASRLWYHQSPNQTITMNLGTDYISVGSEAGVISLSTVCVSHRGIIGILPLWRVRWHFKFWCMRDTHPYNWLQVWNNRSYRKTPNSCLYPTMFKNEDLVFIISQELNIEFISTR